MPVDRKAFEDAIAIQREFEKRYSGIREVVGIGIGLNKAADAPAINVQIARDAGGKLPSSFQGLDVVLDVVGDIDAQ